MTERRVWIAQCLCPHRHAIMATAGEADSREQATTDILEPLRGGIAFAISSRSINPWCHLCRAPADEWRYEIGRTRFATLADAKPALEQMEAAQRLTAAIIGPSAGRA